MQKYNKYTIILLIIIQLIILLTYAFTSPQIILSSELEFLKSYTSPTYHLILLIGFLITTTYIHLKNISSIIIPFFFFIYSIQFYPLIRQFWIIVFDPNHPMNFTINRSIINQSLQFAISLIIILSSIIKSNLLAISTLNIIYLFSYTLASNIQINIGLNNFNSVPIRMFLFAGIFGIGLKKSNNQSRIFQISSLQQIPRIKKIKPQQNILILFGLMFLIPGFISIQIYDEIQVIKNSYNGNFNQMNSVFGIFSSVVSTMSFMFFFKKELKVNELMNGIMLGGIIVTIVRVVNLNIGIAIFIGILSGLLNYLLQRYKKNLGMSVNGLFEICIIGCMTGILIVTVELGLIMNTKLIGVVSFYNYILVTAITFIVSLISILLYKSLSNFIQKISRYHQLNQDTMQPTIQMA